MAPASRRLPAAVAAAAARPFQDACHGPLQRGRRGGRGREGARREREAWLLQERARQHSEPISETVVSLAVITHVHD